MKQKQEKLKLYRANQFAKIVGRSRQRIAQLIEDGTIPTKIENGIKWIDPENKEVKDYIKSVEERVEEIPKKPEPVKVKKAKSKKKEKVVKVKEQKKQRKQKFVKDKKRKSDKNNQLIEISKGKSINKIDDKISNDIIKKLDEGKLSLSEIIGLPKVLVEKIKIYEQTKQIVQKRRQERRELINKKLVRIVFGKLFEIHTNEFLTIKSKITPDLAGIFENNKSEKMIEAEKRIDEELWKVLKHIKFEFDKFLTKAGDEPIA